MEFLSQLHHMIYHFHAPAFADLHSVADTTVGSRRCSTSFRWSSCVKGQNPANFYRTMTPEKRLQGWREAMIGGARLGDMRIELLGQTHDVFSTDIASDKWLCSGSRMRIGSHPDVHFVRPNAGYHVHLVDDDTGEVYWDETFNCMTTNVLKDIWRPKVCKGLDFMARPANTIVPFQKFCFAKNDGDPHRFDLSISSTNYDPKWLAKHGFREGLHSLDGVKAHVIFRVQRKPIIQYRHRAANDGWDPGSYMAPHPYVGLNRSECRKLTLPAEELYASSNGKPMWERRALGPMYPTRFERRLHEQDEPTQKNETGGLLGGRGYYHHILSNNYPLDPRNAPQWSYDGRTPIVPASQRYSLGPKTVMEDTPWMNRHPLMNQERMHRFLTSQDKGARKFLL